MTQFSISPDGLALTWTGSGEYLRIEPWSKDSVRVRASKMHEPSDFDYALQCSEKVHRQAVIEIDSQKDEATLTNGQIVVKANAYHSCNAASGYEEFHCALSFYKKDGTLLFKEISGGGSLNLKARNYQSITGGNHRITVSFTASRTEHLYGMGEYQQDVMDLKGSTFELAHRNSQASVPFVVSSAGYGFLWNNPAIGQATFALNRTEWRADSARQIDYWVTAGDTPAAIERNYANATGHSPMMPEWGLGFWQCKLRYWNQEQLLEVAREFRRRGIPLDLIVIDFFHWPHMGDFSFEREFWPDPKAMCDELHEMGIKLMVSVWPQVAIESENYAEMKSRNLLVMAEKGEDIGMMFEGPSQFFDATNPAARKYVWDKCRANYADLGVDAFWLDEAEPEYGSYDFENYRYYAGSNQQIGNIFFTKYIKIREQLRPYTRELFADAHENGQPLIRGLFYEFPKDLNTADISDEYMFGPDLLVAPVTEFSARKRTVYLPGEASTIWTNLLDGTETTGGQSIVVHAPLESIPVFARNGNDHDLLGKL